MGRARLKASNPAAAGFRMPAEWEPHEATWIGWPHNKTDWPGKFGPIPWAYGEIARRLGTTEGALKVAIHRLRKRFRDLIKAEVAHTVGGEVEAREELTHLLAAM